MNRMHIIEGANHGLDLKCFGIQVSAKYQYLVEFFLGTFPSNVIPTLCPAGDKAGEKAVQIAVEEMLDWL